jgi:hypothetical protein
MKTFKEKGLEILFGRFLFLDCPLKVFLVGPPNHTFTWFFQVIIPIIVHNVNHLTR